MLKPIPSNRIREYVYHPPLHNLQRRLGAFGRPGATECSLAADPKADRG